MSIPTTDTQMKSLIDQDITSKTGQKKSITPTILGNLLKTIIDFCTSFFIPKSEKGQPVGVATLDAEGKVPSTQLPANIGSGGGATISDNDFEVAIRETGGVKTLFAGQKVPAMPSNWESLTQEEQNAYLEDLSGKGVLFFQKFEQDFDEQVPVLDENNQPVLDENNNPTYTTNTVTKQMLLMVLGNYFNGFKIVKNITDNTYQFFFHNLPQLTNIENLGNNSGFLFKQPNDSLEVFSLDILIAMMKTAAGYHTEIGTINESSINNSNNTNIQFSGNLQEGKWAGELVLTTAGFNTTELAKIQSIQLNMHMNNGNNIVSWDITNYLFENQNAVIINITQPILINTSTNFSLDFTFDGGTNPQDFSNVSINLKAFRKEMVSNFN